MSRPRSGHWTLNRHPTLGRIKGETAVWEEYFVNKQTQPLDIYLLELETKVHLKVRNHGEGP